MSLEEDIAKAKAGEQKLVSKLNQEESWISKHPGSVTIIALVLFVAAIVGTVKGCHG